MSALVSLKNPYRPTSRVDHWIKVATKKTREIIRIVIFFSYLDESWVKTGEEAINTAKHTTSVHILSMLLSSAFNALLPFEWDPKLTVSASWNTGDLDLPVIKPHLLFSHQIPMGAETHMLNTHTHTHTMHIVSHILCHTHKERGGGGEGWNEASI